MQASHVQQVPTLGEYLSLPLQLPKRQQPQPQSQQQQQQCERQHLQQQQLQPAHKQHDQQGLQGDLKSPPHQPHGRRQSASSPSSVMTVWQWVPDKVLQKHADCIDVATRASRRCNCFTKVGMGLGVGVLARLATG